MTMFEGPDLCNMVAADCTIEALLEVGTDMAQEIQNAIDAMREASGDDTDGEHLEQLLERWEQARSACYADEET